MSPDAGRLRRVYEQIRSEPGLGRNVLTLVVLVALGLGIGGYILSQQRFDPPWQNTTYVYGTFEQAPGIAPGRGQEVRIAGVPVGDIREASVTRQGKALLLLAIDKSKYDKPVYTNASMVLRPKSPLNEMYVEMNPGGPPGSPVPDHGTLPLADSRSPVEIDQALGHLDDNTRAALRTLLSTSDVALARAPQDLPAGIRSTNLVLRNLQPVVTQLDQRRDRIKQLVTELAQVSSAFGSGDRQLADLANSLQSTLRAVADHSDALRASLADLPAFVDQLRGATGQVQHLSDQLDPTLADLHAASQSLPDSLSRLTGTVDTLRTTLQKAEPVAQQLVPVAGDLRPLVADANKALGDLKPISAQLDPITAGLVNYLPDLEAFVYNTNSLTSLRDANGAILRGLLQVGPSTLPIGGLGQSAPTQH